MRRTFWRIGASASANAGRLFDRGCLGVPALRPGSAIDNPYDAAAQRAAHEGSPLADP